MESVQFGGVTATELADHEYRDAILTKVASERRHPPGADFAGRIEVIADEDDGRRRFQSQRAPLSLVTVELLDTPNAALGDDDIVIPNVTHPGIGYVVLYPEVV
jgi:hypothetical protein